MLPTQVELVSHLRSVTTAVHCCTNCLSHENYLHTVWSHLVAHNLKEVQCTDYFNECHLLTNELKGDGERERLSADDESWFFMSAVLLYAPSGGARSALCV